MIILSIFLIIVCVLLVLVVLSQNSKGGGLSGQFGGNANTSQILGAKRTGDFLEKATWVLIALLFVGSFLSSKTVYISQQSNQPSSIINQINENTIESSSELDTETTNPTDSTEVVDDAQPLDEAIEEKDDNLTDNKSVEDENTEDEEKKKTSTAEE